MTLGQMKFGNQNRLKKSPKKYNKAFSPILIFVFLLCADLFTGLTQIIQLDSKTHSYPHCLLAKVTWWIKCNYIKLLFIGMNFNVNIKRIKNSLNKNKRNNLVWHKRHILWQGRALNYNGDTIQGKSCIFFAAL